MKNQLIVVSDNYAQSQAGLLRQYEIEGVDCINTDNTIYVINKDGFRHHLIIGKIYTFMTDEENLTCALWE